MYRQFLQRLNYLIILIGLSTSLITAQWVAELPTVGSFSSIRMTDLNGDDILDIVIGAGREEFISCDSAVIAIDGNNGEVLWTVTANDQIFGSALFLDITKDGTDDVIIGGRSAELMAIDGSDGEVIWRFLSSNILLPDHQWFNFYNPQTIPDQNGNGSVDIIVSNGGDVMALPRDPDRPAGYLLIIDSQTGHLISETRMPDGKETYMSVVVLPSQYKNNPNILFGTGGETIGGGLYVDKLSNVRRGDLSNARELDQSENKGFIGPPVCADLNNDGNFDIIANAVNGKVIAFDGKSFDKLWEVHIPNSECYSSAAIGQFNNDDVPDLFVSFGQGVWPNLNWSIQKMINGKTGAVEFTDSLGFYQNTSPLAIDLNNDGRDEVIMSLNIQEVDSLYRKFFFTTLVAIEFSSGDVVQLTERHEGSNLSSTPWIGDLDHNGLIDIIFSHGINHRHTYTFDGILVRKLSTLIQMPKQKFWGAYQGNKFNSLY